MRFVCQKRQVLRKPKKQKAKFLGKLLLEIFWLGLNSQNWHSVFTFHPQSTDNDNSDRLFLFLKFDFLGESQKGFVQKLDTPNGGSGSALI